MSSVNLKDHCTAVKLSFHWLGNSKTLEKHQRAQAASAFNADAEYLKASKKLLNNSHPAWKEVTRVKGEMESYFHANTLPYPETGIRLLKKDDISTFEAVMASFRDSLTAKVGELNHYLDALKEEAKNRLGSLYCEENYPATFDGQFTVEWSYPSIEPPEYLKEFSPAVYEQEKQRVRAKFDEAIVLAEQMFLTELQAMTDKLIEQLAPKPDGSKSKIYDSVVDRFGEFFDRFQQLNPSDNGELEALIADAKAVMAGVEAKDLRGSESLRASIQSDLQQIAQVLPNYITKKPKRKLLIDQPEPTAA